MSRCTQLALLLSLAACEQSQTQPAFPEPAPAKIEPAPVVVEDNPTMVEEKLVIASVKPKPAPKPAPTRAAPSTPFELEADHPPGKGHWSPPSCRPGSRMACRWVPEEDERERPRVRKAGDN